MNMSPLTLLPARIASLALTALLTLVHRQFFWDSSPPRIKIQVYIESLCIDSKHFMMEKLLPTYRRLGNQVMDLEVVTFGNAKIDLEAHTVTCQHGAAECDANIYELCAADAYPDIDLYLPFYYCLFDDLPMGHREDNFGTDVFAKCAEEKNLEFDAIHACHYNNELAWKLQKHASSVTPANHHYVPYVVIDGLHNMDEEHDDLLQVICDAYRQRGGTHPACSSRLGATTSIDK